MIIDYRDCAPFFIVYLKHQMLSTFNRPRHDAGNHSGLHILFEAAWQSSRVELLRNKGPFCSFLGLFDPGGEGNQGHSMGHLKHLTLLSRRPKTVQLVSARSGPVHLPLKPRPRCPGVEACRGSGLAENDQPFQRRILLSLFSWRVVGGLMGFQDFRFANVLGFRPCFQVRNSRFRPDVSRMGEETVVRACMLY